MNLKKSKIIWQELSRSGNAFCYVDQPMFITNTGYIMTGLTPTHLKYITAVLNHPLSVFYLEQVYNKFDETGWRWFKIAVEKIPVFTAPIDIQMAIEDIVDSIQEKYSKSSFDVLNSVIDDLYGFTKEEVMFLNNKIRCK